MAAHDRHTRIVGWLKVALPLLALVILSTLFLVSRTIDPSDAVSKSDLDVEDRVREPRMTAPTYAGMTADGAALTLTAEEARPRASNGGTAKTLHADLATPDGARTAFAAATADLDEQSGRLNLGGGVEIETSTGYRVETDQLWLALDRTGAESAGQVTASGPAGRITAGSMTIREAPGTTGSYVLVFKDHVSLVYEP